MRMLKYTIYTVKYAYATCIALIMVKIEQCIMIFICWLHLIWPPCNNCYKLQLFHLDKSTWIFFFFQKHNKYWTDQNLYYLSISLLTNYTSKSNRAKLNSALKPLRNQSSRRNQWLVWKDKWVFSWKRGDVTPPSSRSFSRQL